MLGISGCYTNTTQCNHCINTQCVLFFEHHFILMPNKPRVSLCFSHKCTTSTINERYTYMVRVPLIDTAWKNIYNIRQMKLVFLSHSILSTVAVWYSGSSCVQAWQQTWHPLTACQRGTDATEWLKSLRSDCPLQCGFSKLWQGLRRKHIRNAKSVLGFPGLCLPLYVRGNKNTDAKCVGG